MKVKDCSMAILTISGAPASRYEDVAHGCAQLLGFEFVTESRLSQWMTEEFGETPVRTAPGGQRLFPSSRLAVEHHLVICLWELSRYSPPRCSLRVGIVAPEARRIGNVTLDQGLTKARSQNSPGAEWIAGESTCTKCAWAAPAAARFLRRDAEHRAPGRVADGGDHRSRRQTRAGSANKELLAADAEAQIQFETRLKLARHGIVPAGHARLKRAAFNHPSEEMFANLLDFYRIPWEYEPRSFPLQWDKDGRVIRRLRPISTFLNLTSVWNSPP